MLLKKIKQSQAVLKDVVTANNVTVSAPTISASEAANLASSLTAANLQQAASKSAAAALSSNPSLTVTPSTMPLPAHSKNRYIPASIR